MAANLPDAVTNDPQQVCEESRNSIATEVKWLIAL